ncbi:MAG: C4-type zinc ribbon domain-containing protein [Candidatus Marinimicrobia bacterium]|nr:C4-type zinc ribbon domain-containing protein [Candidatus Neomarinimicrobiota bacterium]
MKNVLKSLIDLQEIDRQLFEIEEKKGSLPAQVEKLESQAVSIKTELASAQSSLDENQKELTSIKGTLMDAAAKVKKYQDQLYLVTTNREYDALTNEIETVKSGMIEMENRQFILESEIETLEESVASSKEQSTTFVKQLEANRDELKEKSDLTDVKQKELEIQREALVKNISQRYLRKYERILKARRRAVVAIERSACAGCHKQLSPQVVYDIRQMDKFIECENCGRILVHIPKDEV